jgi:hypothetical protein
LFCLNIITNFDEATFPQNRNSKSQISNIKWFDKLTTLSQVEGQITMTEIVRASLGLPTLRAGPQFQNSKLSYHLKKREAQICLGH